MRLSMRRMFVRRVTALTLLAGMSLAGCSSANPPAPTAAPAPTLPPTATPIPTAEVPTAAPTATAAPTVAPASGAGKLPALSDPAWHQLAQADLDGDGAAERLLALLNQQVA